MSQKTKKKTSQKQEQSDGEEDNTSKNKSFRNNSADSGEEEKSKKERKVINDKRSNDSEEELQESGKKSKQRSRDISESKESRGLDSQDNKRDKKVDRKDRSAHKNGSRSRSHRKGDSSDEEGSEKYLEKLLFKLNKAEDKIERVRDQLKDKNNLKEKKEQIDVLSGQIMESVKKNKISKVEHSIITQDIRNGMENSFIETMARNQKLEDENRDLKEKLRFKDNFIRSFYESELEGIISHYKHEIEKLHDENDRLRNKKHKEIFPPQQIHSDHEIKGLKNQSIGKSLLDENLWLLKNEKFAEEQFNMDLPPKTLPPVTIKRKNPGNMISQSLKEDKYKSLLEKAKAMEFFAHKKNNGAVEQQQLTHIKSATDSLNLNIKSKAEKKADHAATQGKADYYRKMQQKDKNSNDNSKRSSAGGHTDDNETPQKSDFDKLKKQLNRGEEYAIVKNASRENDSDNVEIFDYKKRKQLN